MATATVGDIELFHRVVGPADAPPIVAVMGLGSDHLAWMPLVPLLRDDFRLVLFDNRDVGRSSVVGRPYELIDLAQDTVGLADALGLEAFHLVGMSMGGAVAQHVAVSVPERVRTLTLISTWAGSGRWARERMRLWATDAGRRPYPDLVDDLMTMNLSEAFFEDADAVAGLRATMLANRYPQPPEAFARQAEAAARHDLRDRLADLTMPVHVIGGDRDLVIPHWKHRELAELIPHARLTVIEGGPHAVNLERPEELAAAIAAGVSDGSGGGG